MVFTAPFTAVPGEIITAAGWNTSARDNLNHIWGVIGGNPGTNNLVPVSTGAQSSAWQKLPDVALADQKISQTNPIITDANTLLATGVYELYSPALNAPIVQNWYIQTFRHRNLAANYQWQTAYHFDSPLIYVRASPSGVPGVWYRVWHAGSQGSGTGMDSDTLRTLIPGNASGNIPISNGVQNTNLHAAILNGRVSGNASGNIPISNGVLNTNLNANFLSGLIVGNGIGNVPINNNVVSVGLNANFLQGLFSGNSSGNIPINNGVMNANLNVELLQGLAPGNSTGNIPVSNGAICIGLNAEQLDAHDGAYYRTPVGAVVWFPTLGQLTAAGSHWTRYTAADGLMLVGAGSSGGQTFAQSTNYGTTWTPAAGITAGLSGAVANGATANSTYGNTLYQGGGGVAPLAINHPHNINNVPVTGSVNLSGTSGVWFPPMRAGIWGQRVT